MSSCRTCRRQKLLRMLWKNRGREKENWWKRRKIGVVQPTPMHGIRLGSPLGRNQQPNLAPTPKRTRTNIYQAGPSETLHQTSPTGQTRSEPIVPLPEPVNQAKTEPGWLPADPTDFHQTRPVAVQTEQEATLTEPVVSQTGPPRQLLCQV